MYLQVEFLSCNQSVSAVLVVFLPSNQEEVEIATVLSSGPLVS